MPAKNILTSIILASILLSSALSPALAALPSTIPNFEPDPNANSTLILNPGQGLGQCWSLDPTILSKDFVSWGYDVGYRWSDIEPEEGRYQFQYFDESLAKIRAANKKYLLFFLTGGVDKGVEYNPPWLISKVQSHNPKHWIASAHLIAPWDEDWQTALKNLAQALAQHFDQDPNIIGVVVPSGCRYGEMSCWCGGEERESWEAAGYTDEKFTQAVEQTVDSFLTYFQHKPVVVQIGGGLNGQRAATGYKLMAEMFAKYGLRVGYKFNGWGSTNEGNVGDYFKAYGGYTSVGYEVGYQNDFSDTTRAHEIFTTALGNHVSFGCLGRDLLSKTGSWENEYRYFARYSGTQIILYTASFSPSQLNAGQPVSIQTSFTNRGTKPLVAAKRVGIKDEPASYQLAVYFIHKTSGQETRRLLTPPTPTNQWFGGRGQPNYPISGTVNAPAYGGTYEVRLALENPYAGPHEGEKWAYVTNQDDDGHHRYLLGEIQVSGDDPPPSTRLGWGRNTIFWDLAEISLSNLWERFPGTIWLSRLIGGLWQTVVKGIGNEVQNIQTNTTFTITQSLPSNSH